ncbi:CDP-diacylglycerol--serine O-phosphatidyltransferase [Candidatus Sumerlaeota bacterium]|nr:CDP-diacylglycerol--serine O-phosphatidyltransferase [Candidatus Sumerlaeales bacterium]NLD61404.1 CDP-diacylglycerol--serine O-phosphatidyltransferase [Candidatus Sumerlaeota bacterium]
MRKIYLLPNLFTTASLFCGGFAILNVFDVAINAVDQHWRYEVSCWLILVSAVLDCFDGWIARMTNTQSAFGAEYDSLSDLVAFGVAPAALSYARLTAISQPHVAEVICTLFIACGALRLARFNVQKSNSEKKSFTGLPIPAAAGTIVAGFLCFQRFDPDWTKTWILWVMPLMTLLLSFLMVSNINYPSLKQLNLEGRMKFNVLPIIVLLTAICIALKNHISTFIFVGFLVYMMIGIVGEWKHRLRTRQTKLQAAKNESDIKD